MDLSQARTRAVLEYCLRLPAMAKEDQWARSIMVAVGMSSSKPVTDPATKAEDPRKSRRVEFRIITDAARQIGEIVEKVKSSHDALQLD